MKKKILLFLFCPLLFLGCKKDFLEKYPLDQLTEETYWTSEANVRTYSWNYYPRYFPGYAVGFDLSFGGFFTGQSLNDDFASTSQFTKVIPSTSTNWVGNGSATVPATSAFVWIRRSNLMIDRVKTVPMSQEAKNHWMGIARFFRALEYARQVNNYGDFPWINTVLDETSPDLFRPRDSRTLVMDSVLADFQYAAANVRVNDGDKTTVNRYAVLARMSQILLFEGTWQKYHLNNTAKAVQYLEAAKWAANEVITKGGYSIAPDYRGLFTTLDLSANPEIILYRRYEPAILMHAIASYNNQHEAQNPGPSKSAIDSYLGKDGLPIKLSPAYQGDQTIYQGTVKKSAAMVNRDPRINDTFAEELRIDGYSSPFSYSTSGYGVHKFLNASLLGTSETLGQTNSSDSPEIRYAEVLLNYAEAAAELGAMTQADLDLSINKLRARADVNIPKLQVIGGQPAVNGVVYDDPDRDPTVPSLIWEIRRERRVELMMEGFRLDDLRRWKKLDYVDHVKNPNANRGAWIKRSDFPNASSVRIENNAAQGYIIPVQPASLRIFDNARVYLDPIPSDQITLYKDRGVDLTQNPGWQ